MIASCESRKWVVIPEKTLHCSSSMGTQAISIVSAEKEHYCDKFVLPKFT